MEQDPNPRVRGGQTLLVLLLIFCIITFMAGFYYSNSILFILWLIILGLMFKLDKKINEIKKEDGHKRE